MPDRETSPNLVSENTRYLLWREDTRESPAPTDRTPWSRKVSAMTGCSLDQAEAFLDGGLLSDAEIRSIAGAFSLEEETLRLDDLAAGVNVLHENIRFLFDSGTHGDKLKFAESYGMTASTVSRWISGKHPPEGQNPARLAEFFGLSPSVNLARDRVFLSYRPVTVLQRKKRIKDLIDLLPPDDLRELLPALEKLLKVR